MPDSADISDIHSLFLGLVHIILVLFASAIVVTVAEDIADAFDITTFVATASDISMETALGCVLRMEVRMHMAVAMANGIANVIITVVPHSPAMAIQTAWAMMM